MAIRIQCEHCHEKYKLRDEHAGKRFKCRKCNEPIVVAAIGTGSRSTPTQHSRTADPQSPIPTPNQAPAVGQGFVALQDESNPFAGIGNQSPHVEKAAGRRFFGKYGTGSLMLAIIALVVSCVPILSLAAPIIATVGLAMGIVGFVAGIKGNERSTHKSAGDLVLSILGCIGNVVLLGLYALVFVRMLISANR